MSQVIRLGGNGGGGLGLNWIRTAALNTNVVVGYGYIPDSGLPLQTFVLPVASNIGDAFAIAGESSWRLTQGIGQSVHIGNLSSSVGVGGSWSSTNPTDTVIFVCITANLTWKAVSLIGMPAPV
jgi:hypothetical protein